VINTGRDADEQNNKLELTMNFNHTSDIFVRWSEHFHTSNFKHQKYINHFKRAIMCSTVRTCTWQVCAGKQNRHCSNRISCTFYILSLL